MRKTNHSWLKFLSINLDLPKPILFNQVYFTSSLYTVTISLELNYSWRRKQKALWVQQAFLFTLSWQVKGHLYSGMKVISGKKKTRKSSRDYNTDPSWYDLRCCQDVKLQQTISATTRIFSHRLRTLRKSQVSYILVYADSAAAFVQYTLMVLR